MFKWWEDIVDKFLIGKDIADRVFFIFLIITSTALVAISKSTSEIIFSNLIFFSVLVYIAYKGMHTK
jgi:hypothetical protein